MVLFSIVYVCLVSSFFCFDFSFRFSILFVFFVVIRVFCLPILFGCLFSLCGFSLFYLLLCLV